ncbi:MAG: HAD hydrolase-like protein [Cyanobacteria bacterium J06559_1]
MTQHILLDLDGTLSDPKVGITQSIRYALTQLNVNVPSAKRLIDCIGPPLSESFADLLPHPSPKKVTEAIALYRDRFSTTGLFENQLYNNISLALNQLKAQNAVLHLATSNV